MAAAALGFRGLDLGAGAAAMGRGWDGEVGGSVRRVGTGGRMVGQGGGFQRNPLVAPWLWGRLVGDTAAEEAEQIAACGAGVRWLLSVFRMGFLERH